MPAWLLFMISVRRGRLRKRGNRRIRLRRAFPAPQQISRLLFFATESFQIKKHLPWNWWNHCWISLILILLPLFLNFSFAYFKYLSLFLLLTSSIMGKFHVCSIEGIFLLQAIQHQARKCRLQAQKHYRKPLFWSLVALVWSEKPSRR